MVLESVIGVALAILSAATSAISVVLVRKVSNQSSTFNISLTISLMGILVLWPLALILTDFSVVNIASILLFGLSGVFTPGLVRLFYYQGMRKLGAPINSSLFSIYPVYTSFLAVLFLSEILAPGNWVGILMVFLGGNTRRMECQTSQQWKQLFRKGPHLPDNRRSNLRCWQAYCANTHSPSVTPQF